MKIGSLAVIAVIVIGLYSCGSAFDKSQKSGDKAQANISLVSLGMTRSEVIDILGQPESDQTFSDTFGKSSCIYYGTLSSNDWQLCFENGELTSKNKY